MIRVAAPPAKPVLIFDGDCDFCRRWIERWREASGDRVEYIPFQDRQVADRFPEIPRAACEQSVQFVDTDGAVYAGADAVLRALGHKLPPGVLAVSEWCYRFVARHRTGFSFVTRALWGAHVERPTFQLSRWVFLVLLAGSALGLAGCKTESDPANEATRPWNAPKTWESGIPSEMWERP